MSSFKDDVSKFCNITATAKVNTAARQIALTLFRKVILRTPVGNPTIWKSGRGPKGYVGGRARGNWQCNVGPESTAVATKLTDPSGNAQIEKALRVMADWKPMGGNMAEPIWLGNALPYIQRLEYDHWSQQARSGMVRISLSEIRVGGVPLGKAPDV